MEDLTKGIDGSIIVEIKDGRVIKGNATGTLVAIVSCIAVVIGNLLDSEKPDEAMMTLDLLKGVLKREGTKREAKVRENSLLS